MHQPCTVLCLADRPYAPGRYASSHPIIEDLFARILPARGYRVIWALHSREPTLGGFRGQWHESDLFILPSAGRGRLALATNGLWRFAGLQRTLSRLVEDERVDVLQVRNDCLSGLAASRVARRLGLPYVFQWSFPHTAVHAARIADGLDRWTMAARLRNRATAAIYRTAIRRATHLLPISEWMAAELVRDGIPRDRMTPFPLGFDTRIDPAEVDGAAVRSKLGIGDDPMVLYCGEMGQLRRLDFLIRSMALVIGAKPRARLVMVGQGDTKRDVTKLRDLATSLGIGERTIFTGFVNRDAIPGYLKAADVVVSPIRPIPLYLVSSPTKLVEAMGMGRPVVANDTPEQAKLLGESGGGLAVPYREQLFAAGVIRVLSNPAEGTAMGRRGRVFVERHRSLEKLADVLEDVYATVIKPRSTHVPAIARSAFGPRATR